MKPDNDKQLEFFDNLIENGGNVLQASEAAGYSRCYAYQLAKKYKDYLIERIEGMLYLASIRAANTVVGAMDTSESAILAVEDHKLKAALQVLDRTGVTKTDRVQVDIGSKGGVFILPAKDIHNGEAET